MASRTVTKLDLPRFAREGEHPPPAPSPRWPLRGHIRRLCRLSGLCSGNLARPIQLCFHRACLRSLNNSELTFHPFDDAAPVKDLVAARDGDGLGDLEDGSGTDEGELLILNGLSRGEELRREGGREKEGGRREGVEEGRGREGVEEGRGREGVEEGREGKEGGREGGREGGEGGREGREGGEDNAFSQFAVVLLLIAQQQIEVHVV